MIVPSRVTSRDIETRYVLVIVDSINYINSARR